MDFSKLTRKVQNEEWEDPFPDALPQEPQAGEIISNGKLIKLNDGQIEALKRGKEFLRNPEEHFICVSGSAGSGKTTIAKAILDGEYSVIVTAPTHKAKKLVSRSTGYRGETIQKIVGLIPEVTLEEFSSDNVLFALSGKSLLADYKIVMIDEASMLNEGMVKLLMEKAIEFDIKLIFLGDARQLPPIKESISKVFTDENIIQVRLTKVERQQVGNPLIGLYDSILTHIDNVDEINVKIKRHNAAIKAGLLGIQSDIISAPKLFLMNEELEKVPFEYVSNINKDINQGYEFIPNMASLKDAVNGYFKIGEDLDNRIIAWQNDTVGRLNMSVRKMLLGDPKAPLTEGEIVMGYRSVVDKKDWRHILYENSADYIIKKVSEGYKPTANYDKTIKADIKGYFVVIQDLDNDRGTEKIFVVKEESYSDFVRIEQTYKKFADEAKLNRKWAWKQYYDFRNQFAVFADIRKHIVGKVKNPKKFEVDFDFSYALTIHKSQGSTYNNVFMIDDIFDNEKPEERWRLAYVGLSRPRHCAYIVKSR